MIRKTIVIYFITAVFFLFSGAALSEPEPIYGSQLMTEQERNEFRERMQNANSNEEREQIRKEHHEKMKERAKAKGVTLPDKPPSDRGFMGSGGGMGFGGGQGGGGR